ncbi:MAG: hypothetical protein M1587_11635 [Thaumarchaeota archaeon]|nr:hypothetical protein [Nitrososphaerota archaeon]MCL5068166.1 hypothetical protein [Nitrososphaerota archaeon]
MKLGRLILSLVGLAMIVLSYIYNNLYFLVIAIVAFFAGLYLMGRERKKSKDREKP